MCVSYRGLNMVTQPFEYPIGRCDAAIEDLGDSAGTLYFICLDKAQGYHQIGVKRGDQEKLAFFEPDALKWTFTILPFGPTNTPPFYTAMIRQFQDEWTLLFRLECNRQSIDYNHEKTSQPPSIFRLLPMTDNYEESCTEAVMPNIENDEEFTLASKSSPLTSSSIHSLPTSG